MRKGIVVLLSLMVVTVAAIGCLPENSQSVEEKGVEAQTEIMKRAQSQVPIPKVENFSTRKQVAKWMERMDEPSKEFYCYLMASNGQIVHHFVTNGRPISVGSFLSPTKKEWDLGVDGAELGPAPALDGVYYGGGGSAGTARFAFDAATDSYFEVVGVGNFIMIISGQPLNVDAPQLQIKTVE